MSFSPATRTSAAGPPALDFDRLEETFSRHQDQLLGMLYYFLGSVEDAQDAYQEAFLKSWRHRDGIAEVKNLRAWVFQVALNAARDLRRTAWRRRRRPMPVPEAELVTSPDTAAAERTHEHQLLQVRNALKGLCPEEQEVFLLRQNAEMTYEEIARVLHIPLGTVKTRMRRTLTKLRVAVEGQ